MTEADLALSEQKCLDLQHALQKIQLDKENEIKILSSKNKRDKDVNLNDFNHWNTNPCAYILYLTQKGFNKR